MDSDDVNVSGSPEIHLARFAQCLSDQGCSLLAWDDSLAWGNNTSLDYQLDYALGLNPDLWKIKLIILELLQRRLQGLALPCWSFAMRS